MANRLLGVISALPEEFAHLSDQSGPVHEIAGFRFWRGAIADRAAVFVECGAGKVNAAVATALLLDRFECGALMMCGVAGGLDPGLAVGDVVVGVRHVQHDFGLYKEEGFVTIQPGSRPSLGDDPTPGYALDAAVADRLRAATTGLDGLAVHFGTILTGDSFVNSETLRQRLQCEFGALAVEMEGGAVAQVARRWGDLPFVNIRSLSDLAGRESHLDFRTFLPEASRRASQVAHLIAPIL